MEIELKVRVPPNVFQVNMVSVIYKGEEIGYINHVLRQIDGDLFLCSVDVHEDKEEYVRGNFK